MGLTLPFPPGYSDLQDSVLVAGNPALSIDIGKIAYNAAFGMARLEVFPTGPYKNGDTVPLPISPIDGYPYSQNEVSYIWAIQNSVDQATGWITGKDSLWYCAWLVDQATGKVFSDEWYRRSGSHYAGQHTNDGTLWVWTIGQRQRTNLVMAASPTYSSISSALIGTDDALVQSLIQGLNDDAKFSVVNDEVIYLGEFYNGQTVPQPVSPADGYTYSYAECKFMHSWRWTPNGNNTTVVAPPISYGQLGPMKASVSALGVVSTSIGYLDANGNLNTVNDGRISIFAFCVRSGTPATLTPAANLFASLDPNLFMPGSTLRYTTVQQILNNLLEAICTPEFFGPTTHQNGDTIPLPTSTIDGYAYARSELFYIWTFTDTTNATGTNLRMASFGGQIDNTTGLVHLYGYRLPPGGPYTFEDQTQPRITVITVARRAAQAAAALTAPTTNPQSDYNTIATDVPTLSSVSQDTFTGNGSTTAFTTSQTPAGGFVMVFVGGQLMTGGGFDYTASGSTIITVTLNTAPASGQKINLIYFQ